MFVDGHLDLAYNALQQRDLTLPLDQLRELEARTTEEAMVTLPELLRAGTGLVFATLFVMPKQHASSSAHPGLPTYTTSAEAHAAAVKQLELYERWEEQGLVRIIRSKTDLEEHVRASPTAFECAASGGKTAGSQASSDQRVGLVLLMENADPIRSPEEVAWWWKRGIRLLGPA